MNEFKRLREAAGLSQKEVADALGYSTAQFVSNFDRSVSSPPFSQAKKLAKLYKVSPQYIAQEIELFRRNQFEKAILSQKKKSGL